MNLIDGNLFNNAYLYYILFILVGNDDADMKYWILLLLLIVSDSFYFYYFIFIYLFLLFPNPNYLLTLLN